MNHKLRYTWIFNLFFLMTLVLPWARIEAGEVFFQKQIASDFGKILCAKPILSGAVAEILWEHGRFEAQVQGKFYEAISGARLDRGYLSELATRFARQNAHNSYAFGFCPDERAWIISFPAIAASIESKKDSMQFNLLQNVNQYCRQFSIDFAPEEIAPSRELALHTPIKKDQSIEINTSGLGSGSLSVTCIHPEDASGLGSQLWYLIPLGAKSKLRLPHSETFKVKASSEAKLLRWINTVRSAAKVGPLRLANSKMKASVEQWLSFESINHSRKQLKSLVEALKTQRIKLIGENRGEGESLEQLAWLLWSSPRHRNLLLTSSGEHVFIKVEKTSRNYFAVILLTQSIN